MAKRKNGVAYTAAVMGARGIIRILLYALVLIFFLFLARTAYTWGYAVFNEQPMAAEPGLEVQVTIPEGASALEIGEILDKNGLIASPYIFFLQERLSAYHGKLQPGTYILNTSQTPTEMMGIIAGDMEDAESESS